MRRRLGPTPRKPGSPTRAPSCAEVEADGADERAGSEREDEPERSRWPRTDQAEQRADHEDDAASAPQPNAAVTPLLAVVAGGRRAAAPLRGIPQGDAHELCAERDAGGRQRPAREWLGANGESAKQLIDPAAGRNSLLADRLPAPLALVVGVGTARYLGSGVSTSRNSIAQPSLPTKSTLVGEVDATRPTWSPGEPPRVSWGGLAGPCCRTPTRLRRRGSRGSRRHARAP